MDIFVLFAQISTFAVFAWFSVNAAVYWKEARFFNSIHDSAIKSGDNVLRMNSMYDRNRASERRSASVWCAIVSGAVWVLCMVL